MGIIIQFTGTPRVVMMSENTGTILIADDNISNLQLLVTILSKYHYEISVARSGTEALNIIHSSPPDIILLDIMMPGLNGFEVCEHLKSSDETRNIPVIFLSALDDIANKLKGFETGGVDYITKPFYEEEVIARVKTHLSLRKFEIWQEYLNTRLREKLVKQEQTQEELQKVNVELENQVNERTEHLAKTNEQLQREIQERRQAESDLQIKKEELERFFTFNLILLCILNKEGHFIRLNAEWENTLGYPISELKARTYLDLVHPDELEKTREMFDFSKENAIANFTCRFRHSDGIYQWLEWCSFPNGDKIYAVARDVTRTIEMENERAVLLDQIQKNIVEMTILNDGIRNPLSIIVTLVELSIGEEGEGIIRQVNRIDEMITNLDRRWVESEKILSFLRGHYGIEVKPEEKYSVPAHSPCKTTV